jgi:hypothetical protein
VNTRTLSVSRTASRTTLALAAFAAIALALFYIARPVHAGAGFEVDNHQLNDGKTIDSSSFHEDPSACDNGGFDSGVTWHFVLNKYESGDADLYGHFQSAGDFGPIDSADRNGNTLFFYVNTPADDTLVTNWAILDTQDDDAQLQLSGVCHGGEQSQSEAESQAESQDESQAESQDESQAESEQESAEGSNLGNTGTPEGSVSNGAVGENGVSPLPTLVFSLILLASLGGLAFANVKTARNRS